MNPRPDLIDRFYELAGAIAKLTTEIETLTQEGARACRGTQDPRGRGDHLVRLLGPTAPDMTLEQIAARFRCDKCGLRGGRIKTEYVGPTTDGR